jgi:hypothetical protein
MSNSVYDFSKIIKRLEILRAFIILHETDEIPEQLDKLRETPLPEDVLAIIRNIEQLQWEIAMAAIDAYISANNLLAVYKDGETLQLESEIKRLEEQLQLLELELAEAEKLVHEFTVRHSRELGPLILELLALKSVLAKSEEERKEAEYDEQQYKEGYEANKAVEIAQLGPEEKQRLVKQYREASRLCHPDKFANEAAGLQKEAEEAFVELNEAYKANNLKRVEEILRTLEEGRLKVSSAVGSSSKEKLKTRITHLQHKIATIGGKIRVVKQSTSYLTATKHDWEMYFEQSRSNLQQQIEELRNL